VTAVRCRRVQLNRYFDAEAFRRHRLACACAVAIAALALVETANALLAPLAAPLDKDWRQAAAEIRAGFRAGDLIVAAPAWADPFLRLHLGDLIPIPTAGRLDAARFGRVWEISQRGAHAPESEGGTAKQISRHGALTLRRYERPAAHVFFDFVADWNRATVSRVEPNGQVNWCNPLADQFQCPDVPSNPVKAELLEIDTSPHFALGMSLAGHATTVVEYDRVPLGRELAVGAGLHNVWLRKAGKGIASLRVLIAGREWGRIQAGSLTGWTLRKFDTSALAGQSQTVRFEITVDDPNSRYLGFAAEARN
jgi:hypothetical protein